MKPRSQQQHAALLDSQVERVDAIIIGASIRGLVTAQVLDSLGRRTVVIERGASVGGADGSFQTAGGSWFDFGLHVLDYRRSQVATKLFEAAVDGRVHRQSLRRAIVLRGHVLPYNPRRDDLPPELRQLVHDGALVDDLGCGAPNRARLGEIYGRAFADLIFDEVLPSYPTENRHRAFGVDEARLVTNIYPWFFPRAQRRGAAGDPSRAFHDRLRSGQAQEVLYPHEGGFGGFAGGFAQHLNRDRVELLTGARDLHVELGGGRHHVDWVAACGRRFAAPHVFWAAPWPALCELLDLPCQRVATDRVLLGSFRFDAPIATEYHELLVGDRGLWINRVSRPAAFRGSDAPLLQVEFAVPLAEDWPEQADVWRGRWLQDLRQLRLIGAQHRVEEFDFKSVPMHFNAFGAEGEPLRDADPSLLDPNGNLYPVAPSMANWNLNAYVPQVVSDVTAVMARS